MDRTQVDQPLKAEHPSAGTVDAPHNVFEFTSFLCVFPSLRELLFVHVMNDSCVTNLRHALPDGVSYEEIKVSRNGAKTQRGEESI